MEGAGWARMLQGRRRKTRILVETSPPEQARVPKRKRAAPLTEAKAKPPAKVVNPYRSKTDQRFRDVYRGSRFAQKRRRVEEERGAAHSQPHPQKGQVQRDGLKNTGNSCYFNAVLQALFVLPAFIGRLREHAAREQLGDGPSALRMFLKLVSVRENTSRMLDPTALRVLTSKVFRGRSQQDAHEFLVLFLDQLHSESGAPAGSGAERGPVLQGFAAHTAVVRSCTACESASEEPIVDMHWTLSLSLPAARGSGPALSLGGLLANYFSDTAVEYKCDECSSNESVLQASLARPPGVLAVHLSRFGFARTASKRTDPISFPLRLCLDAFCSGGAEGASPDPAKRRLFTEAAAGTGAGADTGPQSAQELEEDELRQAIALSLQDARLNGVAVADEDATPERGPGAAPLQRGAADYQLGAVVCHRGEEARSGHYVCYARSPKDGSWKFFDDAKATTVPESVLDSAAVRASAYLLFYVPVNTGPVSAAPATATATATATTASPLASRS